MKLIIDESSSLPNYQQIIYQIKEMILNNTLKPNDQLPSIRNLSKELNIAIITIKRAYEELEKENIVYTISGKGVYISDINKTNIKQELTSNIRKEFQAVINQAQLFNFSKEELLTLFTEELNND